MTVTKELVQELRARTNAGILACKKMLIETNGDIEAAAQKLRAAGIAKADKKVSRATEEGRVFGAISSDGHYGFICTLSCETDFVADGDKFQELVDALSQSILDNEILDENQLPQTKLNDGSTFDETRKLFISTLGENIQIGRFVARKVDSGCLNIYAHHDGKRCVLVHLSSAEAQAVSRDVAMHILVSRPIVISPSDLKESDMTSQLEVFKSQVEKMKKPAEIADKIMAGKVDKYKNEISLLGQPFVKNPDINVAELLRQNNTNVESFSCVVMGEDPITV